MPTAATIVVADSTPTNRTYSPVQISPALSMLLDKSTANIAEGQAQIILGFSLGSTKRPTDRVVVRHNFPVEREVDGVWTVVATARFIGEWIVPTVMTQTERNHFEALCDNLVSHATVEGYVADRDPFYG